MDDLPLDIFELKEKWWICSKTFQEKNRSSHQWSYKNEFEKSGFIYYFVFDQIYYYLALIFFAKLTEACIEFIWDVRRKVCVGKGSFGKVYRADYKKKEPVLAMKIYKNVSTVNDIEAEVRVLSLDRKEAGDDGSEYIPKLIYSGYTYDFEWCVMTEYVKGGTLWYHIFVDKSVILPEAKQTILYQIARGLEFLHGKNLTHGDLKTDNIALTSKGYVRLLDFNNSRIVGKNDDPLPQGAVIYQAPEVAKERKAGLASDLYSYGVTMAHFITQKLIIRHKFPLIGERMAQHIKTGNIEADKLIHGLLLNAPEKRINQIKKHPYFKNVSKTPSFIPGEIFLPYYGEETKTKPIGVKESEYLFETSLRIPKISYIESIVKDREIPKKPVCDGYKRPNVNILGAGDAAAAAAKRRKHQNNGGKRRRQ